MKLKSFKQFLNEFEIEGEYQEKLPVSPFSSEDMQKVVQIIAKMEISNYKKISDLINVCAIEYDNNQEDYKVEFYMDANEIAAPNDTYEFYYDRLIPNQLYRTNEGEVSIITTSYDNNLFEIKPISGISHEMRSLINMLDERYEFDTFYLTYGMFENEKYNDHLKLNILNYKFPVFHSVEEFRKYMEDYDDYLGRIYPVLDISLQEIMNKNRR